MRVQCSTERLVIKGTVSRYIAMYWPRPQVLEYLCNFSSIVHNITVGVINVMSILFWFYFYVGIILQILALIFRTYKTTRLNEVLYTV